MHEDDSRHDEKQSSSRYRWKYGPLRLLSPWVSSLVGIVMVVMNSTAVNFWLGWGLITLGVVAFFLYRWMAKRGI